MSMQALVTNGHKSDNSNGSTASTNAGDADAVANQAFAAHLAAALALADADVLPFKGDASLVNHNCKLAAAAVLALGDQITEQLPTAQRGLIQDLPSTALGFYYASIQVETLASTKGQIAAKQKEARPVRTLLSSAANTLMLAGYILPSTMDGLKLGRGKLNSAKRLLALATLLQSLPADVVRLTPVTPDTITTGATLGSWLLNNLRPTNARKPRSPSLLAAQQLRDRFYTLVTRGYRETRRVGMWFWVDDVNDHVPPLSSRERGAARIVESAPAAPAVAEPVALSAAPAPTAMTVSVVVPANSEVKKVA